MEQSLTTMTETSGPSRSPELRFGAWIEPVSGDMGPVAIGGNMDDGATVSTDHGNIAAVAIGGDLDARTLR